MPDEPRGYRDSWGQWHDYNPPDLGLAGVHRPGSLDPKAAVREAEAIVGMSAPDTPSDTAPTHSEASDTVVAPLRAPDGYWRGGVFHERPPKPKPDAVQGIRAYLRFLRESFDRDREP